MQHTLVNYGSITEINYFHGYIGFLKNKFFIKYNIE